MQPLLPPPTDLSHVALAAEAEKAAEADARLLHKPKRSYGYGAVIRNRHLV